MTKTLGVLTPPTRSVVCAKCSQIKKQAEEAFTQLRLQTDSHIDAIQQQLSEEYGGTINELKAQYDELFGELVKAREAVKEKDSQHVAEMDKLRGEIGEQNTVKQTISSLEKMLADTQIQLEKSKSLVTKVRSECDKMVDQMRTERDDAVLEVNRLVNKVGGVDTLRHEYEMERARADLAYRKRIGEMESEVRRTEIESVRLRKQILSLNQKIEMFEHQRFSQVPRLFDDLRRSRILSIESEHQPVSGRIARLALPTDQHGDVGRLVELSPAIREPSGVN
jgi:chromosome segregation ATPase